MDPALTLRQAAASLWTVRSERAYNDVSPSLDCLFEPIGISGLIGFLGEEMERGPVVPQIVRLRRLPLCHVCDHPLDVGGGVAETLPSRSKRDSCKIENG